MCALCAFCRPFLPLFVILAAVSCLLHSTQSSLPGGKLYPRGNHWAVGHLMGKKSIRSYAAVQYLHDDSAYGRSARTAQATRTWHQKPPPKQRTAQAGTAHHRALMRSRWRQGGIYKYLREMTSLLRMALKLQDIESV